MLGQNVVVCNSLDSALQRLQESPLAGTIESTWIIGGSSVYKDALASPHCFRIYLTKILKTFECDTFLPEIPLDTFKIVRDPNVPEELQEEDGFEYQYHVYERLQDVDAA
jgi:dihydrofolate reductase